jgi:hypothetical protein
VKAVASAEVAEAEELLPVLRAMIFLELWKVKIDCAQSAFRAKD